MAKKRLRGNTQTPFISVIVVCRPNESPDIALHSLKHIRYPRDRYEVILVTGWQVSQQRNIAIKEANGELVYLLDNDSAAQPNALLLIAQAFENKQIGAVGGPSLSPRNEGVYISKVIGCILETHFGALRMRLRYSQQGKKRRATELHLIGANLALRKKPAEKVGGFDEKVIPNEETELLVRLQKKGFELLYLPELVVFRSHRPTLQLLCIQFFYYGRGRTKQLQKVRTLKDVIFLIPVVFLAYLFSLIFIHSLLWISPLLVYLFLSFATSAKAAIKYRRLDLLFVMPLFFPIIHIAYASGIIGEYGKSLVEALLPATKTPFSFPLPLRVLRRDTLSRK